MPELHGPLDRHGHGGEWGSAEPDAALVEFATGLPPGRALDLGAGEGRNSLWLARAGWQVTAVDLSAQALARVTAAAEGQGLAVATVVADMHDFLARSEPFDLVVVAHIHPPSVERAGLFAAAARAVAQGGHLCVVGHHVDALGLAGPPDPERLYTVDGLREEFADLELLRLERREHPAASGSAARLAEVVAWATRPGSDVGGRS